MPINQIKISKENPLMPKSPKGRVLLRSEKTAFWFILIPVQLLKINKISQYLRLKTRIANLNQIMTRMILT